MTRVERVAEWVAARHGRDPWRIAQAIELPIYEMPLPGKYREVYFAERGPGAARAIVLAPGATTAEGRELLAHGLAHHFLHAGNRLFRTFGPSWHQTNEREADDFAACLLVPGARLAALLSELDPPSTWELSERFDVGEGLVARRAQLLQRSLRLSA